MLRSDCVLTKEIKSGNTFMYSLYDSLHIAKLKNNRLYSIPTCMYLPGR